MLVDHLYIFLFILSDPVLDPIILCVSLQWRTGSLKLEVLASDIGLIGFTIDMIIKNTIYYSIIIFNIILKCKTK